MTNFIIGIILISLLLIFLLVLITIIYILYKIKEKRLVLLNINEFNLNPKINNDLQKRGNNNSDVNEKYENLYNFQIKKDFKISNHNNNLDETIKNLKHLNISKFIYHYCINNKKINNYISEFIEIDSQIEYILQHHDSLRADLSDLRKLYSEIELIYKKATIISNSKIVDVQDKFSVVNNYLTVANKAIDESNIENIKEIFLTIARELSHLIKLVVRLSYMIKFWENWIPKKINNICNRKNTSDNLKNIIKNSNTKRILEQYRHKLKEEIKKQNYQNGESIIRKFYSKAQDILNSQNWQIFLQSEVNKYSNEIKDYYDKVMKYLHYVDYLLKDIIKKIPSNKWTKIQENFNLSVKKTISIYKNNNLNNSNNIYQDQYNKNKEILKQLSKILLKTYEIEKSIDNELYYYYSFPILIQNDIKNIMNILSINRTIRTPKYNLIVDKCTNWLKSINDIKENLIINFKQDIVNIKKKYNDEVHNDIIMLINDSENKFSNFKEIEKTLFELSYESFNFHISDKAQKIIINARKYYEEYDINNCKILIKKYIEEANNSQDEE